MLEVVGVTPSPESRDYVEQKTQFQLHSLLTEQRHPRTLDLDRRIQRDLVDGLRRLSDVDADVDRRLLALAAEPAAVEALVAAVEQALESGHRIYVYGCGATGRLAKQMESTFWRPFWRRVLADPARRQSLGPRLAGVEEQLIGEMTGADRALVSSLEGFEDLPLIGRLQLEDHGIGRGDVVIAVTEGGETSSVIGTLLAARAQWQTAAGDDPAGARAHLFFVYNNPDERLRPFERSRRVLDDPGLTGLNLATGPQAITGSTRMQATSIETFVVGQALEEAVRRVLARRLDPKALASLGFAPAAPLAARWARFPAVRGAVRAALPQLARLTALEADTYAGGHFSTYFAEGGLLTVFIDGTERSPTFRLWPLDTVRQSPRRCWFQVWTPAADGEAAWRALLGRPFRGLDPARYQEPFATGIEDPWLRRAALESLGRAGDQERNSYDFAFAPERLERQPPQKGDLGVLIAMGSEVAALDEPSSPSHQFARGFAAAGAPLGLILVGDAPRAPKALGPGPRVALRLGQAGDPFGVGQQVGLKMLLNIHSTAVMARLGKVVGNTMTSVSPSNLKLVGRATSLILAHVNDVLARPAWVRRHGARPPLTYAEANAVLFDSIASLKARREVVGQDPAEVPLSIVRILESLRRGEPLATDEALQRLKRQGLASYLEQAAAGG